MTLGNPVIFLEAPPRGSHLLFWVKYCDDCWSDRRVVSLLYELFVIYRIL